IAKSAAAVPTSAAPAHPASAISASYIEGFAKHTCTQLSEMRQSLAKLPQPPSEADLQEAFGDIYIGMHSLKAEGEHLQLKAFVRLADATGKLLRKVLEKPASTTPSVVHTLH